MIEEIEARAREEEKEGIVSGPRPAMMRRRSSFLEQRRGSTSRDIQSPREETAKIESRMSKESALTHNKDSIATSKSHSSSTRTIDGPDEIRNRAAIVFDLSDVGADQDVVAVLRCRQEQELERLERENEVKKTRQLRALHDRLAKQKEKRAQELVQQGVSIFEAVERANEEEVAERLKAEVEVLEKCDGETAKAEEALLKEYRDTQARCVSRLNADIEAKETQLRADLQARLAKKKAMRAASTAGESKEVSEEKNQSDIKDAIEDSDEAKIKEEIESKISQLKQAHESQVTRLQDEMTSRKKEAGKTLQSKLADRKNRNIALSTSKHENVKTALVLTVDTFIQEVKMEQKERLRRLRIFLSHMHHHQNADKHALPTSIVVESLINGFKKQCVYEMKLLSESKQTSSLSEDQRQQLFVDASSQMMRRYERDVKTSIETLHAERLREGTALREARSTPAQLIEAEQRRDLHDLDQMNREQGKLLYSLAGLSLRGELLKRALLSPAGTEGKSKSLRIDSMDLSEDFDDGDDEEGLHSFIPELAEWMRSVVQLESAYSRCVPCLYSLCRGAHARCIEGKPENNLSSGMKLLSVFMFGLTLLGSSFSSSLVSPDFTQRVRDVDMAQEIEAKLQDCRSNGSLLACFTGGGVSERINEEYRKCFHNFCQNPSFTVDEIAELYLMMTRPVAAAGVEKKVESKQLDETKLRTLQILIDKRKKALNEIQSNENHVVELENIDSNLQAILTLFTSGGADQTNFSAECIFTTLSRKAGEVGGLSPTKEDLLATQEEMKKAAEQAEVKRMLSQQVSSAEKLDMQIKLQKIKEQQKLQKRLLQRRGRGAERSTTA